MAAAAPSDKAQGGSVLGLRAPVGAAVPEADKMPEAVTDGAAKAAQKAGTTAGMNTQQAGLPSLLLAALQQTWQQWQAPPATEPAQLRVPSSVAEAELALEIQA